MAMAEMDDVTAHITERIKRLEHEVENIKMRNASVELRKSWETSKTRLISITAITYITMTLIFYVLGSLKPYLDALVPTTGFFLSTLSLSFIKKVWERDV